MTIFINLVCNDNQLSKKLAGFIGSKLYVTDDVGNYKSGMTLFADNVHSGGFYMKDSPTTGKHISLLRA